MAIACASLVLVSIAGCGDAGVGIDAGAGVDAGGSRDAGSDRDAAVGTDADIADAGAIPDAGPIDAAAPDAATSIDAGVIVDAGSDAGIDGGVDAGTDGGVDAGADAGPPAMATYCVDIDVSNTCEMTVTPTEITIPAGQTAYFCWRNRSRDYEIDVWLSYGGGYTELATGATWNEPVGHCLGPTARVEYADITTACSEHRFLIRCL